MPFFESDKRLVVVVIVPISGHFLGLVEAVLARYVRSKKC